MLLSEFKTKKTSHFPFILLVLQLLVSFLIDVTPVTTPTQFLDKSYLELVVEVVIIKPIWEELMYRGIIIGFLYGFYCYFFEENGNRKLVEIPKIGYHISKRGVRFPFRMNLRYLDATSWPTPVL